MMNQNDFGDPRPFNRVCFLTHWDRIDGFSCLTTVMSTFMVLRKVSPLVLDGLSHNVLMSP